MKMDGPARSTLVVVKDHRQLGPPARHFRSKEHWNCLPCIGVRL